MSNPLPGIYLFNGKITSSGLLISEAENDKYKLIMDGIFFDEESDRVEAEVALDLITEKGIEAIVKRNGHFNIALRHKDSGNIELISDILATKPWYFYSDKKNIAAAPDPGFFAGHNLEMELNLQAVFETIVFNYTLSDITLISEIKRNIPFFHYRISEKESDFIRNHELSAATEKEFNTKEKMAEKTFEIISRNIRNIINNRKLRSIEVQMPLTGGMDSRHILGTLLKNRKKPVCFRHINVQGVDSVPVDIMAKDLGISLIKKEVPEINFRKILEEWLIRSNGFINFHQAYLLEMLNDRQNDKMMGFDGYLMDSLTGIRPRFPLKEGMEPSDAVITRPYGSEKYHRALFPDYDKFKQRCLENISSRPTLKKGNNFEKGLIQQIQCRSVKYTGSIFPVTSDEFLNFAPGACFDALNFAFNCSWKEGMYNKARFIMLEKYFPEMNKYPSVYGYRFSDLNSKTGSDPDAKTTKREDLLKLRKIGFLKNFGKLIPKLTSGLFEPVKEGEHFWLRRIPELRKMMDNFVSDSLLVKDSVISKKHLEKIWKDHKKGAFNAWTMMNIFTVECAYRTLVKKQSIDEIVNTFSNPEKEVEQ